MSYSSDFLSEGYLGNLNVLHELQFRLKYTNAQAAKTCFVSEGTYRRWLRGQKPNPTAVKLLAILAGYVPWGGWEDWEMHNGYLFPPGFTKQGILPGDWFAAVILRQLVSELKRKIQRLEIENRQYQAQLQKLLRERPAAPILRLV